MNRLHEDNPSAQVSQSQIQVTPSTAKPVTSAPNGQNSILPAQTVEPVLGFTPVEIRRAEVELNLTVEQLLKLDSCKEYVKTPIQTLDGIYVHQPQWFLPLTKEAEKLAEALKKEQVASQWAGILHEKLLQESFVKQLNSI